MNARNGKRLVLLAGGLFILSGIVGLALHSPLSAAGRDGRRGMRLPVEGFGIERWKAELGLSEQQIEQLRELRAELHREHAEKTLAHAQIDLELSDEQIAALRALHERHAEQREAMREKHREELEALKDTAGLTEGQIAGLGILAGGHRHDRPGMNLVRRGRGYGRLAGAGDEMRERLSKILTDEQMQKLDDLREELRDVRRGEGRRERPLHRPRIGHDDR